MRRSILAIMAAASAVIASPAIAGKPIKNTLPPPEEGTYLGGCSTGLTDPNAIACSGYYAKNIIGGSDDKIAAQIAGVAALPGDFTWDGNFDEAFKIEGNDGDTTLDFGVTMFGLTIIGAHYGNVDGDAGNVTVFWLFDFGTEGRDFVTLTPPNGWSNAYLYTTGGTPPVPEPATWAMMLLGFGAAGTAMRRSRRRTTQLAQLA